MSLAIDKLLRWIHIRRHPALKRRSAIIAVKDD